MRNHLRLLSVMPMLRGIDQQVMSSSEREGNSALLYCLIRRKPAGSCTVVLGNFILFIQVRKEGRCSGELRNRSQPEENTGQQQGKRRPKHSIRLIRPIRLINQTDGTGRIIERTYQTGHHVAGWALIWSAVAPFPCGSMRFGATGEGRGWEPEVSEH
jgi:hypothetical protein